jgi:hypothetical protein
MICKNHYGTGSFLAGGKIMHQISIIVRAGLVWLGLAWLGLAWLGLAWLGIWVPPARGATGILKMYH